MKHSELTTPHDRPSRLWRPGALACALAVASGLALAACSQPADTSSDAGAAASTDTQAAPQMQDASMTDQAEATNPLIAELMDAIRAYPDLSNAKRVTFEYVMLKGVNDSLAEARALVKLLRGIPSKINLIPFNPWPGSPYECSDWDQIEAFADVVNKAGYA